MTHISNIQATVPLMTGGTVQIESSNEDDPYIDLAKATIEVTGPIAEAIHQLLSTNNLDMINISVRKKKEE